MAKRLPTFLGKPLKAAQLTLDYFNNDCAMVHLNAVTRWWVARTNIPGFVQCVTRGTSPQEALDKCEAAAIKQFRAIGAQLGYEVE